MATFEFDVTIDGKRVTQDQHPIVANVMLGYDARPRSMPRPEAAAGAFSLTREGVTLASLRPHMQLVADVLEDALGAKVSIVTRMIRPFPATEEPETFTVHSAQKWRPPYQQRRKR
jgi:hypothetical protein